MGGCREHVNESWGSISVRMATEFSRKTLLIAVGTSLEDSREQQTLLDAEHTNFPHGLKLAFSKFLHK
jgi:hypothetical protein